MRFFASSHPHADTASNRFRRHARGGFVVCGSALAAAVLAVSLAACTSLPKEPQGDSSKVNETVEQAIDANKAGLKFQSYLTLLNIVRTSRFEPDYWVDIQQWQQSAPFYAASTGITFPFGVSGSLSRTSAASSNNIVPLNTQSFERAITTPMSVRTLRYFSDQGYPESLLLHLFVQKIDVYAKNGDLVSEFVNNPTDRQAYARFDALVNDLSACRITQTSAIGHVTLSDTIGPSLKKGDANSLKGQIKALDKGYVIVNVGRDGKAPSYVLIRSPAPTLEFDRYPAGYKESAVTDGYCMQGLKLAKLPDGRPKGQIDNDIAAGPTSAPATATSLEIELRSPEATVYYLGQVLREQAHAGFGVGVVTYDAKTGGPNCHRLFVVLRRNGGRDAGAGAAHSKVAGSKAQSGGTGDESPKGSWQIPPPGGCYIGKPDRADPLLVKAETPPGFGSLDSLSFSTVVEDDRTSYALYTPRTGTTPQTFTSMSFVLLQKVIDLQRNVSGTATGIPTTTFVPIIH